MVTATREPVLSDFGEMLADAMRRKAAELGAPRYTYRDLEKDSGVHFTYAQKAVKYGRVPTREIIGAWAKALAPYFPLNEALIAAYVPNGEQKRALMDTARGLAGRVLDYGSEDRPQADAEHEPDNQ